MPDSGASAPPIKHGPVSAAPAVSTAVVETEAQSTASEGDLGNDTDSLERQAAISEPVDPADDLLNR